MGQGNNPFIQPSSPTRRTDAYLALIVCVGIAFAARQFGALAPTPTQDPQQAALAIDPIAVVAETVKPPNIERAAPTPTDVAPIYKELLSSLHVFDPPRRIDRQTALAVLRPLRGLRSAVWTADSNLLVMIDAARYRKSEMVEQVCGALAALGDTRAIVVDVQDVDADERIAAGSVGRACQQVEIPSVLAR